MHGDLSDWGTLQAGQFLRKLCCPYFEPLSRPLLNFFSHLSPSLPILWLVCAGCPFSLGSRSECAPWLAVQSILNRPSAWGTVFLTLKGCNTLLMGLLWALNETAINSLSEAQSSTVVNIYVHVCIYVRTYKVPFYLSVFWFLSCCLLRPCPVTNCSSSQMKPWRQVVVIAHLSSSYQSYLHVLEQKCER